MFYLKPPRHISTLPKAALTASKWDFCYTLESRLNSDIQAKAIGHCYFNDKTTRPATGSVTPRPPPRSSSASRKESRVEINIRPRLNARVHVFPLSDDAVGTVTGLDNAGVHQAYPSFPNRLVGIQKLLIASRLHSKTHNIESGHRSSPIVCEVLEDTQPVSLTRFNRARNSPPARFAGCAITGT
jgi:hypothetical protein